MNKKLLIIGGVVLVLMIVVGGVLFAINNNADTDDSKKKSIGDDLIKLSAEEVGLKLAMQKNNQELVMELTKLDDIKSFEYEANYDSVENGETISDGVIGSGPNEEEVGKSAIKREIYLGTCSSGTCVPDKGITEIDFILKVDLKNGDEGIVEETVSLK